MLPVYTFQKFNVVGIIKFDHINNLNLCIDLHIIYYLVLSQIISHHIPDYREMIKDVMPILVFTYCQLYTSAFCLE